MKIKVMQQKIQGLKKEFSKKDVNRARNLIMGKTGASTGTQVGYKKQIKDYKEGDVWTEGRKTWTIKNGIKQTVSKLDKVKKEIHVPLCCPKCSKVMKHHLDKNNYEGSASDVVGIAKGFQYGSAFKFEYALLVPFKGKNIKISFDDWIFKQDEKVAINRATLTKFGFKVGELTVLFKKN